MKQIHKLYASNKALIGKPLNFTKTATNEKSFDASLYIYDVIDSYWGVNAQAVAEAITSAQGADTLHVYINTPGGDVFEARAIMAALRRFDGKTAAHIDSLCASAGTSIALACDTVEMSEGAMFMIHNASGVAWGDKTELRETADVLEKIELAIVNDYTTKTGKPADEIVAMMEAETWMTAQEALDGGFVDSIATGKQGTTNAWNLAAYKNAPKAETPAPENKDTPAETPAPEPARVSATQHNQNRLHLALI
jgi:ATP-dependent Clp protease protease subunit